MAMVSLPAVIELRAECARPGPGHRVRGARRAEAEAGVEPG